jgi:hypothetical protein
VVECQLPKLDVAGSTPVSRSNFSTTWRLPEQSLLQNTSQGSHPRIRHSGHFVSQVIDSIAEALSKFVE